MRVALLAVSFCGPQFDREVRHAVDQQALKFCPKRNRFPVAIKMAHEKTVMAVKFHMSYEKMAKRLESGV